MRWLLALALFASTPAFAGNSALDIGKYKDNVVYVDFWASWCEPCKASFPWLNHLQKTLGPKGLKVVSVNLDRDKKDADDFLKKYPAQFEVIYDPEGKLAAEHKVMGMPTSIVFNHKGEKVGQHIGFNEKIRKDAEVEIKKLVAERSKK